MTRHIVLVGLMGSGKTTVGRLLAERLRRPLVDTDEAVEAATGRTVRDIWLAEGEPAYRVLENGVVVEALGSPEPSVIAAAGGVVLAADNRRAINDADALVVWLSADPGVLVGRAVTGAHRPLLDDDPRRSLEKMAAERADLYAEVADVVIDVTARRPDEIATEIAALVDDPADSPDSSGSVESLRTVTVPLGERSYDVLVGRGALRRLGSLLPATARRVAVITQGGIPLGSAESLAGLGGLELVDRTITRIEIGDGETAKSLTTIEHVTRHLAMAGITRNDVIVGLGGGMVTDVAGFAASVWHRGVPVVHVATTLLGMVDAAIGGKTGVNLPEGKNLVGAFWQPAGVICDLDALDTLPPRERRSGDGEMAKYHFLVGEDLAALPLRDRVARCVQIKADVVASDEREGGRRALLNYGHTLAHALEIATGHAVTHGEAVGIGLIFAARLAQRLGRIDRARVDEHVAVVSGEYGLPTEPPDGLDPAHLLELMGRDKKALDGLTFVLDGPHGVEVVVGVEPAVVLETLHSYGAER